MACRSEEKTKPVIEDIQSATGNPNIDFVALDLGDLKSVRTAAQNPDSWDTHPSPGQQRRPRRIEGHHRGRVERTFGVNHLGHFLFTNLLLERLKESAPARIVIVASKAHYKANGIDFEALRRPTGTPTGFPEYAVSKLCNVLHARSLAKRLEGTGVTTYALHPGVVASDVWRKVPWPLRSAIKLFMITNEEGAKTSLFCAMSPAVASHSGRYYDDCAEREPSKLAQDVRLAESLWSRSEEWTSAAVE